VGVVFGVSLGKFEVVNYIVINNKYNNNIYIYNII
jgi:hypothetical protein